ncbi:hypothetical protein [Solidesulfovibrio sp.]
MLKRILVPLVLLLLLALFVEGVSYLAYFLVYRKPYSTATVAANARRIAGGTSDAPDNQGSQKDYLIDPYFGYVSLIPPSAGETQGTVNLARSFGFDTAGQIVPDYPDKVFTVAVLGGSVAKYFAANMAAVLKTYVERLPQAKGRDIVVLGLGNYSYKQPQQLNIITDFLAQGGRFDVVVTIDGFNEVAHPEVHNIANAVSPFFPSGWADRVGEISSSQGLARLGEITLLQDFRAKAARLYEQFGHGMTLGTLWSLCDQVLANRIHAVETARLQNKSGSSGAQENGQRVSPSGKVTLGPARSYPPDELYPDLATHWAVASAMMHNAVASAGGRYIHYLQPNQYDKGSKPLSVAEAAAAFNPDSPYKPGVEQGYDLLRAAGGVLAASGVEFIDASRLFAKNSDTLYLDDCCHYNASGEELLARSIGETILAAGSRPQAYVSLEHLRASLDAAIENPGRVRRLATVAGDLVARETVRDVAASGLWPREGTPEAGFRWGVGPRTALTVWAPPKSRLTLTAQLLSAVPDQVVMVVVNGKTVDHWRAIEYVRTATQCSEKRLTVPASPGRNVIVLDYGHWLGDGVHEAIAEDPRPFAVMFKSLVVETKPE